MEEEEDSPSSTDPEVPHGAKEEEFEDTARDKYCDAKTEVSQVIVTYRTPL